MNRKKKINIFNFLFIAVILIGIVTVYFSTNKSKIIEKSNNETIKLYADITNDNQENEGNSGEENNDNANGIENSSQNNPSSQADIKYHLENENEWQDYTGEFRVYENTVVHAKSIFDGIESDVATKEINNIDKVLPTLTSIQENDLDDNISSIDVVLTDNASGIVKYGVSASNEIEPDYYEKANQELSIETTVSYITENGTHYMWIWDAAGNCGIESFEIENVKALYVAEITYASEGYEDLIGTQYYTLKDAIDACPNLEDGIATISIIHNIYNEANTVEKNITLDINGFYLGTRKNEPTFTIDNNGELTIINNKNVGQIENVLTNTIEVNENAKLTLGKKDRVVSTEQPNIVGINNTIKTEGTFNFYDGVLTAKKGEDKNALAIYGNVTDQPEIYVVSAVNNTEPEVNQIASLAVLQDVEARIGRTTYHLLEDAIAAAGTDYGTDGSQVEIWVVKNLNKTSKIVIDRGKNIKLNLDSYTINSSAEIENYGDLEIVDDSEEGTGTINAQIINAYATVEIEEDEKESVSMEGVYGEKPGINTCPWFTYSDGKMIGYGSWRAVDCYHGWLEIDLTDKTGEYSVVVDYNVSGGSSSSYGSMGVYSTAVSEGNYQEKIVGNIGDKTFISPVLNGGFKYYLNMYVSGSGAVMTVNDVSIAPSRIKEYSKIVMNSGTISKSIVNTGYFEMNGGVISETVYYRANTNIVLNGGEIRNSTSYASYALSDGGISVNSGKIIIKNDMKLNCEGLWLFLLIQPF